MTTRAAALASEGKSSPLRARPHSFSIRPEVAKALSGAQECALLRQAIHRNPGSVVLRLKLAKLLNLIDAFDECIALLGSAPVEALSFSELLALARALLARGATGDARTANDVAQRAHAVASSEIDRSTALAEAAKAAARLSDRAHAIALLEEALRLDPHNSAACKRLTRLWLHDGSPEAVLALTGRLAALGVGHSRLLSARMLAFAQLGQVTEARQLLDIERFVHRQQLPVPSGWSSINAFNSALAAELAAHPGLRYGRYGTASRNTWRIDAPATGGAPAARALLLDIATAAQRHVGALRGDHPWLAARPDRATLASWCVITQSDGFEDWHTHPNGWMSGVYYVDIPDAVRSSKTDAGALVLGLPEGLFGDEAAAAFGRELVHPRPGLLVLFPSHGYHRTYPHRAGGKRICLSFDLVPASA